MTTRTVHIALLDTLADWEIGYLVAHLANGRHQKTPGSVVVRTVGVDERPVTTMGGLRLTPDVTIAGLRPEDSAMLVLPGADTWDEPRHAPLVAAASAFLAAGVPVAAVCGATFALARAGLLDDRPHTSNDPHYLASSGYAGGDHYVDGALAVVDGDLITASGVAPVHFARAVFERLDVYEPAVLDSWFKLYGERDPAGFFELMAT